MQPNNQTRTHAADFVLAQSYVGLPYVDGEFDCAHLYLKVQREVFGRELVLPTHHEMHRKGHMSQGAQIRAARDELAVQIKEPTHGCAVLMVGPSEVGELWHIGTVLDHNGHWWVLHNSRPMGGVALNNLRDFAWRGQRIEGFYEWK